MSKKWIWRLKYTKFRFFMVILVINTEQKFVSSAQKMKNRKIDFLWLPFSIQKNKRNLRYFSEYLLEIVSFFLIFFPVIKGYKLWLKKITKKGQKIYYSSMSFIFFLFNDIVKSNRNLSIRSWYIIVLLYFVWFLQYFDCMVTHFLILWL